MFEILALMPKQSGALLAPATLGFLNFEKIKWLAKLEAEVGQ